MFEVSSRRLLSGVYVVGLFETFCGFEVMSRSILQNSLKYELCDYSVVVVLGW